MLRRGFFYLLMVLFALGTLYGMILVAAGRLPVYTLVLLLAPVYAAYRCFHLARWAPRRR